MKKLCWLIIVCLVLLAACARPPVKPVAEEPVIEEPVVVPPAVEEVPVLQAVSWSEVSGWQQDNPSLALGAFLQSCSADRKSVV